MTSTKPSKIPVLIIGGPTASGKSQHAINYARENNGVIINGDSMQIYKELPILTAQPSASDLEHTQHKLYGELSGGDQCSVARWQKLAIQAIEDAWQQNKAPIVVGGTGMYLKSLTKGISSIPDIDPAIRTKARSLHKELGNDAFYKELQKVDADMASKLHPSNTQRVIRAYEVMLSTGNSLAQWQQQTDKSAIAHLDCTVKLLMPTKEELHERANKRFGQMIKDGALHEVQALLDKNYAPTLPVMKAIGVQELMAHLQGKITLSEALELAQIATRQYIKRQLTWFKNQ